MLLRFQVEMALIVIIGEYVYYRLPMLHDFHSGFGLVWYAR